MTDPRLLECARALLLEGVGDFDYDDRERLALACILKWLEQEPSAAMRADGASMYPDYGTTEAYTAMNAQAAKELKGD